MAELRWSVEALSDLDEIASFISRQSPSFAPHFIARVVAAAEQLDQFPRLGRVVPELRDDTMRELIFQGYRIVYSLEDDGRILILGVIHGALDLERQATDRSWHLS